MIFSLVDSFLALLVRMCGFVRLHLYISSRTVGTGSATAEPLSNLMRAIASTTENIGGISFGIGSCLFFFLFFKSRYIPRVISVLGFVAPVIWTSLYFASLIFPECHSLFQYICFPPMVVAEVATGLFLILFAIGKQSTTPPAPASSAAEV